ncbi:MAG: peroxiredoxin [Robiginitalea sp.]|nr:peroxiredoxin [Robiginitalea sp.]
MGLPIGSAMPEFSLKDQEGNLFHSAEHLGEKPLVIFFYPKDFTPGCTAEACAFRDHYEDFTDAGALVIGISSDSQASHRNFANRHRLPFILLSDPSKEVRRKFRVKNRLLNLLPGRETFVVDKKGKIVMTFDGMQASGHVPRALKALKKL